ncbi:STAS domain-containing protein [Streptomyces sp. NPDC096142]|uniref:STAS domain-containing protein n=1 Tax=Streptomyces sp. NPDC096142 TaxID=3366077 RepID=UPI0038025821
MTEIHTGAVLRTSEHLIAGTTVLELHGEVDVLTGPPLSARLDTLTAIPHPDLVLDLRSVSFIDCTGLGVLCRAQHRTGARGGRFRLVTGDAGFLRILRHAQLGGVFEIHARLPKALTAEPTSGDASAAAG